MYSQKTFERFRNPKYIGELENPDAVGEVGNMKCGDVLKILMKIENNIIKDIKFQTYGCISAIASSDMVCELAKNKSISEALKITHKDIIKEFDWFPAIKVHCSILGIEALKKAIENYKDEKEKTKKYNYSRRIR